MLSAVHDFDVYGDGFADGKAEGYSAGNTDGQEIFAKLVNILLKENKLDDIQRASTDSGYRNELYEQYSIKITNG